MCVKTMWQSSLVTLWVEDLVWSLLWCRFNPRPRNFHMSTQKGVAKKKKKRKNHMAINSHNWSNFSSALMSTQQVTYS